MTLSVEDYIIFNMEHYMGHLVVTIGTNVLLHTQVIMMETIWNSFGQCLSKLFSVSQKKSNIDTFCGECPDT